MIVLPNIEVHAQIYSSTSSIIYRGVRITDRTPVILKVLKGDYPTSSALIRYRQEYEITRSLNLQGVIQVYSQQDYGRSLVMTLEDFGGESLEKLRQALPDRYCPMPIADFLRLAIKLTDILGAIHAAQIIHRDINLSNIVLNPATGTVKIIDFGIATQFSHMAPGFQNLHVLEGTLAYLSPEQTGRMNRVLDYRTDFYSLGVTFYELLTGQLPFATDDVLELVHCHIAREPIAPHQLNSQISPIVSEIILKLMAKNAEERYQSAEGIKADLESCLLQLKTTNRIEAFSLGQQDSCDRFQIPQKLYGRAVEVGRLIAAFERVAGAASSRELVLVSGYSGIGKSALVQEIYKPVTQSRGFFVTGKFDQFGRNVPYSAMVDAFRSLMRQILAEPESALQAWRSQILAAAGAIAQVLIDVIPEVELILGAQPPVPEVGATEAQNRFNLVFQKFIRVFCSPEHPLVIFLDDLQWVDSASLKLIELMIGDTETRSLLLIGAYRDNEVDAAHSLTRLLNELQGAIAIERITLAPLALEDTRQLIAETLHRDLVSITPFADLVQQKTLGNPFFVEQFLKTLHHENLIEFDRTNRFWQWDLARIEAQNITDNVVELMIDKLKQLPASTQRVLQLAACVGAEFSLDVLAIVCEQSAVDLTTDLNIAVRSRVILPISDLDEHLLIRAYRFLHDRVQQAAYALIDENQKQAVHLQIGRNLWHQTDEAAENIFAIVDHLNLGIERVTDLKEREEIAQLNLLAGQRAKAAIAYRAALKYLAIGTDLLTVHSWQHQYHLSLALYSEAAEVAYLCGHFDEIDRWATVVFQQAKSISDKVKIYQIKIQAYVVQSQQLQAIKIGLQALEQLGIHLPESPTELDIQQKIEETSATLAGRSIKELINLPAMTDTGMLTAMHISSSLASPTYQVAPMLFLLILCEQVNLLIKYGNAPSSAFTYARYGGMLLNGIVNDVEPASQFGELALRMEESNASQNSYSKTLLIIAMCTTHIKRHLRDSLNRFQQGYSVGIENGDFEYGSYNIMMKCEYAYFSGLELTDLEQEMSFYNHATAQLNQRNALVYIQMFQQVVLNLLGKSEAPWRLHGEIYNEDELLPTYLAAHAKTRLNRLYLHKLILCYLFEEITEALENSILAEQYLAGVTGAVNVPIFYFYDSLTQLAAYTFASNSEQEDTLIKVASNQKKMQNWAHHAPMNFQHKYDLVEAEKARILDQVLEAEEFYERAIQGARDNEYIQEEALAYELAAKFYLARGREKIASTYIKEAHYCYDRWGAKAKVKDLENRYPQLLDRISVKSHSRLTEGTTNSAVAVDLVAILKAAQALSESIHLDQLITTLMQVVIENAGAEKGVLLLEDGQLSVVAQFEGNRHCNLAKMPVADCHDIPATLIYYIERTQKILVLDDAAVEPIFAADPYIQSRQPRSLLCTPIIHQNNLVGILYLENNLSVGAFTSDRLEVLNLLIAQAAISLENARLYDRLENYSETLEVKVEERTQALQQEISDRLQTEEALRASEAELKLMFDAMTDAVTVFDVEGRYLKYIQTQTALIYKPRINRIGKTLHEVLPKETADLLLDAIRRALYRSQQAETSLDCPEGSSLNQRGINVEYSLPIQGKQIWFSATLSGLSENTVLCVARDISDRKQAEEALRRSEAKFRNIFENSQVGIFRTRLSDGLVLDANQRLAELFGFDSPTKIIGIKRTVEFYADATERQQAVELLRSQGELQNFEVRMRKQDGTLFWGLYSSRLNAADGSMEGVIADVTDRKQAEVASQQSEATNQILMNAIPDLLIWARADGTYLNIVSQGSQKPFSPDRFFSGGRVADSLPPDLAQRRLFFMQQALQTGEQQIYEQQLTIDGQTQDEEVRIVVTGEDEVLIMVRDITERKRAEVALQQAKLAAEVANRTKSQFLANMSHELRTPLNIILGFTQLLSRDHLSTQQQEHLGTITRSGEHLLELINDVLEMSKIEAGRASLNETSFDLYHQLNTLDDMWQPKALSKRLQLTIDRQPDLPQYIKTDEGKLRQVLMNLLSNAIKFTQTGRVSLRVRVEEMRGWGDAEIRDDREKFPSPSHPFSASPRLYFEVEDTGDGIAPDELKVLFNAFVQTETGRKSQQGTGLGLAISREFVRLMGGNLTLDTQVGQGTTFRFDLPLTIAAAVEGSPQQLDQRVIGLAPDQPRYRLLVVEDRWENRQLLIKLLEPLGFEVRQAVNGQEAITLWQVFEPHLIWMDLRMPVMDGYEATKQIKAQPKGQSTVIIALTASAFEEERVVALSAGCDDFIRKPFREAELFEKMARYLGVRYRYEERLALPPPEVNLASINSDLLDVMSVEWRSHLHQAATQVDAEQIVKLIDQIPAEHDSLALAITNLVNQYRFDRLVELTHLSA